MVRCGTERSRPELFRTQNKTQKFVRAVLGCSSFRVQRSSFSLLLFSLKIVKTARGNGSFSLKPPKILQKRSAHLGRRRDRRLSLSCLAIQPIRHFFRSLERLLSNDSGHLQPPRMFGGLREKLPFPRAVFTILSENNRREKLLR